MRVLRPTGVAEAAPAPTHDIVATVLGFLHEVTALRTLAKKLLTSKIQKCDVVWGLHMRGEILILGASQVVMPRHFATRAVKLLASLAFIRNSHFVVGDDDVVLLAGAYVLRGDDENTVGVDVEAHVDFRHALGGGGDAFKYKLTKQVVILRVRAFAFENFKRQVGLVIGVSGEDVFFSGGVLSTVVLGNQDLHHTANRFNAHAYTFLRVLRRDRGVAAARAVHQRSISQPPSLRRVERDELHKQITAPSENTFALPFGNHTL
jgi:hypothetical protein